MAPPLITRQSLLPGRIPPQTVPLCHLDENGQYILEINWYLFLYQLFATVLESGSGSVPLMPTDNVPLVEIDAFMADVPQAYRQALNAAIQLPEQDVGPTLRDLINAVVLSDSVLPDLPARELANATAAALDDLIPDPLPAAQPKQAITVGASPYTYTAPFNGSVLLSGGNVTSIALVRQGASTTTGLAAGMFPMSRLDQLVITYVVAPTAAAFFPT